MIEKRRTNSKQQRGFTILELLVVVTILAVIAGGVISSISGQEERAGQGVAAHTMGALEGNIRAFRNINGQYPNGFETLVCVEAGSDLAALTAVTINQTPINTLAGDGTFTTGEANPYGGLSNLAGVGGGLTAAYAGNLNLLVTPAQAVQNLYNSGISTVRYVASEACDDTNTTGVVNGETVGAIPLVERELPLLAFDDPVEGDEGGAGFEVNILDSAEPPTSTIPLMYHDEPAEIGAEEFDFVAVLGIGQSSELVGQMIGRAPSEGNVGRDKYSHYAVAFRLGHDDNEDGVFDDTEAFDEPEVIAILDGDGDALEEELAEFRGTASE